MGPRVCWQARGLHHPAGGVVSSGQGLDLLVEQLYLPVLVKHG